MKVFDTNHILRFILKDNLDQAYAAKKILDENEVYIPYEVIAEAVYVMIKVYKIDKKAVVDTIGDFLRIENVRTDSPLVTRKCLYYYRENSLDFVDCLLCAYQIVGGYEVCTFDKKLNKLIERETHN